MKYEVDKEKKIRVVVIDSGIDSEEGFLRGSITDQLGYCFSENKGLVEEKKLNVRNEHGTLIAKTIKYICSCVEFISINILDENLCADGRTLLKALQKAAEFKPDIVHLSLGTTKLKYWYPLKVSVRKLSKQNSIVVAAASNDGQKSYPAYYNNVIGTKGIDSGNENMFYYNNKFFYSSLCLPELFLKENNDYRRIKGNSISAAYITGHLSRHILKQSIRDSKNIIASFISEGTQNSQKYLQDKKELTI